MKKIDPTELTKIVDNILFDSIKSYNLAEKVINAIKELDSEIIAFKNYDFVCPHCHENSSIEEVMNDVTLYSVVGNIMVVDGELVLDYGNTNTSDGDTDNLMYQCFLCGGIISEEEIINLIDKE